MSDGGPQFANAEFERFPNEWCIDHNMPSPNISQSNGLAENGVEIEKRIFRKAADKGEDQYLAMLSFFTLFEIKINYINVIYLNICVCVL